MVLEGHIEIGDALIEGDIQTKVGDPLTEEDTLMEGPLVMEDPLEEDTLVGDLLVMEDPLDLLGDQDHQALKDHLDQ